MLQHLIAAYGCWAVFATVAAESSGLPLPGETALIAAAAYAGTTHRLAIGMVILAAATGAVLGDNVGFWLGRTLGTRVLLRYGRYIHLGEARLKLGRYLFARYGGRVVFFGRFVAVLRAFAAVLAGANRMPWRRFLAFNAAGAVLWATLYGFASYALARAAERIAGRFGLAVLALAAVVLVWGGVALRRREAVLQVRAEAAFPGPLAAPGDPAPAEPRK
jgi:membrane protein DedA with SNARE-associated domain